MTEQAYFEDFNVGDRVRTPARTITETDLVLFNALAGNFPWDCAQAPSGERISHGLYTLIVSGGLMFLAGDRGMPRSTIALLSLEHVRFAIPAKAGDTVHVEAEVTQTTQVDGNRGLIAMTHRMKNQRGEEILTYTGKILAGRRPAAAGIGHG